jgi:hypothetical protein
MNTYGSSRPRSLAQVFPSLLAFVCSYKNCGKALSSSANLRRHVDSIHLLKKKFECCVCGKRFTAKQNLKHHLYIIHHVLHSEVEQKASMQIPLLTDMLAASVVKCDTACPFPYTIPVKYVLSDLTGAQELCGTLPWIGP